MTRQNAQALDARDPLASLRAQFTLPEGVIYLDGNSLGVLPAAAPARVAQAVQQEWGEGLIR
ncbi:MAG TPA: kynureninase, partial [Piscinibacter sp.]|nr:kynureninase [Piscinibacter sp.]